MSLILYGAPLSPFVRKADALLREKGATFELESVNIMPMPDWFKEISPARRIPVLRDTSIGKEGPLGTIPDSSAICAYAERKFPEPALYPGDPYEHVIHALHGDTAGWASLLGTSRRTEKILLFAPKSL